MPKSDTNANEHIFQRSAEDTDHLGLVLPGSGYTIDMPALYYARQCLAKAGADVLSIRYSFTPSGDNAKDAQKIGSILAHVEALFDVGIKQREYKKFTIVAKSLGTVAAGYLVMKKKDLKGASVVWLTPLLQYPGLMDQIKDWHGRSQFVMGTADSYYDAALLKQAKDLTKGTMIVLDDVDHGLEMPNDVDMSIKVLQKVVKSMQGFIKQVGAKEIS
jgi:hypothetical protein